MCLSRSCCVRQARLFSFACALLLFVAFPARADFTFTPFNMTVVDEYTSVPLVGAPEDTYTSFTLTVDWNAMGGGSFSEEAAFALAGGPAPYDGYPIYLDGTFSSNGVNNADSRTLTWEGFLKMPYLGGDSPLHLYGLQVWPGTSAVWENVTLTLGKDTIPPPPALAVGNHSSTSSLLVSNEVKWFSFDYITGPLVIDTLGSDLAADNDTEIGLYNAAGNLIATNDDIDLLGGNLLSELRIDDGVLDPGTFYVALGGFDTTFDHGFKVESDSDITGTAVLNIQTGLLLPEATTVNTPSSTHVLLEANEVEWFTFEYITGSLVIDTLGAGLTPVNDTELGLYDAAGNLLATNDDADFAGGNFLSRLDIMQGMLMPGTYYVAMGGFNTVFEENFHVTSESGITGAAVLNVSFGIGITAAAPEPATMPLFAVGGLLVFGFRKRIRP